MDNTDSSPNEGVDDELDKPQIKPKFDISTLPDDHPLYQLEESRAYYEKENISRPPFTFNKNGSEKYRPVLLAPDEDSNPPEDRSLDFSEPIIVRLVRRGYGEAHSLWTLALNGTRWIVKIERGGAEFFAEDITTTSLRGDTIAGMG